MSTNKSVRVRIAPSPTGENLHIGHANTALVDYVFAKQNNGKFVIRIEDTDRTRFVEGSEERILESLRWLGLNYDEGPDIGGDYGPYRQSDRLDLYKKYAKELIDKGMAYYCFCTPERLDKMRKEQQARGETPMYDGTCKHLSPEEVQQRLDSGQPHVIRLNVPDEGTTTFHDVVRGDITFENRLIDDQVLIKSDGFPTYHMAVVVDDHLMEISHVIRGEDWISSTPKHVLLYKAFGWELPVFVHLPLLRNKDKSKLSKRKNPVWMSWYREQGFLPQAIINYLGTLIWPRAQGSEIFSLDEMIQGFDINKINPTGPIFDLEKLRWMNGVYIRSLQVSELASLLVSEGFVNERYAKNSAYLERVVELAQERLKVLSEFWDENRFFFEDVAVDKELVTSYLSDSSKRKEYLNEVVNALEALELWETEQIEKALREIQQKHELKPRAAFMTIRAAVSGQTHTPPLFEMLEVLGRDVVLDRLIKALDF